MHRPFLHLLAHPARAAALLALVTLLAAAGLTRLRFDDEYLSTIRSGDAAFARLEAFLARFGGEDRTLLVVVEATRDDLFTPGALEGLRAVEAALLGLDGVERVDSMLAARRPRRVGPYLAPLLPRREASEARLARARREAREHPLVGGHLLSPDARATLFAVRLASTGDGLPLAELERRLGAVRAALDKATDGTPVRARITGVPAIRLAIVTALARNQALFNAVGALLAAGVAWLLFRSAAAVVVVGAPPVAGVLWTLGALGLLDRPLDVVSGTVAPLVLAVGLTDAIHLAHAVRRARRAGAGRAAAAAGAVRELALPCALTSFTTAVGFGSLLAAQMPVVRGFGLACALGAGLTFVAVLLGVPLLAATRLGDGLAGGPDAAPARLPAILRAPLRRPGRVSAAGVALALVLAGAALRLEPDNRSAENLPRGGEAARAFRTVEDRFGGVLATHVVVEAPAPLDEVEPALRDVLAEVHAALEAEPRVGAPLSLLDALASLPGDPDAASLDALPAPLRAAFVDASGRATVVSARMPDRGARANEPAFRHVDRALADIEARHPGFRLHQTGLLPVAARNTNLLIADLARSLALANVVIFATLCLALRSARLGLLAVLPNALPLLATAALLVALGLPLQGTSVVVFSVALGIAVDDTIHLLARFRREQAAGRGRAEAVERALARVAPVLATTTAVLVAGFGTLLLSDFAPVRLFGALGCWALGVALVGDLVLLPALPLRWGGGPAGRTSRP